MPNAKSLRVWDASECALLLIDYQDYVLDIIFAQDRRVIELNVRTLAKMARAFKVPVILSTVGVEMGVGGPTIASLRAALPNVPELDRMSMNAWADPKFVAAVKAIGARRGEDRRRGCARSGLDGVTRPNYAANTHRQPVPIRGEESKS